MDSLKKGTEKDSSRDKSLEPVPRDSSQGAFENKEKPFLETRTSKPSDSTQTGWIIFRVTHKGWELKDDLKLFGNMTIPSVNYVFCPESSLLMADLMIWGEKKQVYSCRESWI